MWYINATEDLKFFIPQSRNGLAKTSVDVTSIGFPRFFDNERSARMALGHWFAGPYVGSMESDGYEEYYTTYDQQTDPARREVWENKLAPRQVRLEAVTVTQTN